MTEDIFTDTTIVPHAIGADAKPLHPNHSEADREIHQWQQSSAFYVTPDDGTQHIVDVLIKERAPRLSSSLIWPLIKPVLYQLLGYKTGVNLVNTAGRMSAADAFTHASRLMGVKLQASGTEHIPKTGGCILVLNHPTGIADGLAAHDLVLQIRPDPIVFVNGDAIRLNPRLREKLIPVEWHEQRKSRAKSRETVKATKKAFADGRAVILFPSGRLAYMNEHKQLRERPWMSSAVVLAKKYKVPIVPVHLKAKNSKLFYWLWKVNEELRDMTVFREWFNKNGSAYTFTIEAPIQPEELLEDNDEAIEELQAYVEDGVVQGLTFQNWKIAR